MTIERIGVHDSTGIDFPFEALAGELAGIDPEVVPSTGSPSPSTNPGGSS